MTTTETLLRRERLLLGSSLLLLTLLSWYYLLTGAGTGMSVAAMSTWQFPPPLYDDAGGQWSLHYGLLMLLMWWVMMIAMMLPSAAPMILLYARVQRHNRQRAGSADSLVPCASFLSGYLLAWLGFSLLVVLLQWLLERAGILHSRLMWSNSRTLSGLLLLAAAGYQLSPLKQVCLRQCRAPAQFLSQHWRQGRLGALRMGLAHGQYCVGCCWLLMLLLFVGGVMNLVWIAALTLLVLLEKLLPGGERVTYATSVLMLLAGAYLLLSQAG